MDKKVEEIEINESMNKLINLIIEAGVDLEKLSKIVLTDFREKTLKSTKDFYKIAKKNNRGKNISFLRKNIVPLWKGVVESNFEQAIDLRKFLSEEDFINYIGGLYISIHSKKIVDNGNIGFLVKATLAEMFQKVAYILKEKKLIKVEESKI